MSSTNPTTAEDDAMALAKAVERRELHRSVLLDEKKKESSQQNNNSKADLAYLTSTTTNTTTTTTTDYESGSLQAELIDDVQAHHAKIMQAAKADILSKAVLAEVQNEDESDWKKGNASRRLFFFGITLLLLAVVAIIVGSVCGTGHCRGGARVFSTEQIVEVIQAQATLPVQYIASNTTSMTLTPEERALQYVVEYVPENGVDGPWRFVQRYGVCVLLFATSSDTDNTAFWFAQQQQSNSHDECSWNGIACDANGRVVEINALLLQQQQNTPFEGTLPADLGVLTDLTALHLADQALTGTLPTSITQLTRLVTLDIADNAMTGSVVPTVLPSSLQHYSASDNAFTGTIPTRSLARLTELQTLDVRYNRGLRGTVPSELGALTHLTALSLGGHGVLTGTLPTVLQQLTTLRHLAMERSSFDTNDDDTTNQDLTLYTQLTQLTHLRLAAVWTTPQAIPSVVADAWPHMESFQVLRNRITGTLPPELAQWTALTAFSVLGNENITGTIPETYFASWTDLQDLQLWGNAMSGTIPTTVAALTDLKYFDVSENRLTGTLPTEVGAMTQLRRFAVHDNQLTGTIPVEVLQFASNSVVWLELNDFTGTAPFCPTDATMSTAEVDCDEVSCPCCSKCQADEERR